MRISIITVCYNSAATIESTIKSVLSQNFAEIEYIIKDGGSTDGTMAIVEKYRSRIAKIISSPDKGIYDAMNQGIVLSTGEVVGIINSDDKFFDAEVLREVARCFEDRSIGGCYGDLVYVSKDSVGKEVRKWRAGEYQQNKLAAGWIPPHPTFFVRRKVYEKYGLFNTDFKIAADYELMLRLIKNGIKLKYLPSFLVCMRAGGHSAGNLSQRFRGWSELRRAWQVNSWQIPRFFIIKRLLSKVSQYFLPYFCL